MDDNYILWYCTQKHCMVLYFIILIILRCFYNVYEYEYILNYDLNKDLR